MYIRRTSVRVALHILYGVRTLVDGSAGGGVLPIAIRIRITDVYIGVTHTIGTNNLQGDDSEVMFGRDFALMSVR